MAHNGAVPLAFVSAPLLVYESPLVPAEQSKRMDHRPLGLGGNGGVRFQCADHIQPLRWSDGSGGSCVATYCTTVRTDNHRSTMAFANWHSSKMPLLS